MDIQLLHVLLRRRPVPTSCFPDRGRTVNAPLKPIWLARRDADVAPAGELKAAEPSPGPLVERHLWHSRFGTIEVEVRDGEVYVNGEWVRPAEPEG
jgi:hypothetical protein